VPYPVLVVERGSVSKAHRVVNLGEFSFLFSLPSCLLYKRQRASERLARHLEDPNDTSQTRHLALPNTKASLELETLLVSCGEILFHLLSARTEVVRELG
jgi:hypothetical protein